MDGVTYDPNPHTAVVSLKDDGKGGFLKTVTYDGTVTNAQEITNTYTASGEALLYAQKADGGKLGHRTFSFELKDEEGTVLQTVKGIEANQKAVFDPIKYEDLTKVGEHTYYISEVNDGQGGVTYDGHTATVTIAVNDNRNGKLNVTYNGSQTFTTPVFTNSYEASGNVLFAGDKKLTGRDMTASDVFTFEIREGDKVVATAQNDATGKINYPTITYTLNKDLDQTGIHTYTVKEASESGKGITVDPRVHTVTVYVYDNGDGKLIANPTENATILNFVNTYTATGTAQLYAQKASSGNLGGRAFSFVLSGDASETVTGVKAGETATFATLNYTLDNLEGEKSKTFTYYIHEANDRLPGVAYDPKTETIEVYVKDEGDGTLSVRYNGSDKFETPKFTNTYTAEAFVDLSAKKVMKGRDLVDGEFTFTLTGNGVNQTKTVAKTADREGIVTFDTLKFAINPTADMTDYIDVTDEFETKDECILTVTVAEVTEGLRGEIIPVPPTSKEVTITLTHNKATGELTATTNAETVGLEFINRVVKVQKVDITDFEEKLTGAHFQVFRASDKQLIDEWESDKDKPHEVTGLTVGVIYILHEEDAPEGYTVTNDTRFKIDDEGDVIPVDEDSNPVPNPTKAAGKNLLVASAGDEKDILWVRNEKTLVKVNKIDVNGSRELAGATIQIRDKDGNVVYEWVSKIDEIGEAPGLKVGEEYTLHEEIPPTDYAVTSDTTFTIDKYGKVTTTGSTTTDNEGNTVLLVEDDLLRVPAFVRKVWDDDNNRDGLRLPALEVELLANGELTGIKKTLNEGNHWSECVTGLRKSIDGKDIEYTWTEPSVPGYESKKTQGDVLTVLTNTHGPAKTEVSVTKVWKDGNNAAKTRPPFIKVQLFADGIAEGDPVMLSAENGWAYTWKDLCVNKNESGRTGNQSAIQYTVAETEIPDGYVCKVTGNATTGFVITNSRGKLIIEKEFDIKKPEPEPEEEEETTDFEVEKVWVGDNDNADGNRPESITVRLYAGGQEIKVVKLTAKNGWKYHFGELPKFVDGKPIHYSVKEDPVEGYATEIHGFTIYNKYQPEMTQVTVRKVWNDENNKQNKRPTSIWMKLSNGMAVMLNEANGWTATIAGLPTKVNGKPAEYTWTEQTILGYELESKIEEGNVTIFTNKLWTRPDAPSKGGKPKTAGDTWYVFEEYDTPLGVEVIINHVGDCFD